MKAKYFLEIKTLENHISIGDEDSNTPSNTKEQIQTCSSCGIEAQELDMTMIETKFFCPECEPLNTSNDTKRDQ